MLKENVLTRLTDELTSRELLLRIAARLDAIDTRTVAIDDRTRCIEDAVERQATTLDSGFATVHTRCDSLARRVDEHRDAVDDALVRAASPLPTPWWRQRLDAAIPEEQRGAAAAAAAAAAILAVLLARRRSRRALNAMADRVPMRALLAVQLAASAVLMASQAADNVHALPLVGPLLAPCERLSRPRRTAQGALLGTSIVIPWKVVLALVALRADSSRGRAAGSARKVQ